MMKEAKPFLNYEQQISKLRDEKGLTIIDEEFAVNVLKRTSYFSLIIWYKHNFKNKTTGKYLDGVNFNDIYLLYKFDENLRIIFLNYILKIERHLKSLISYYYADTYGELQYKYLDCNNYNYNSKYKEDIEKFIRLLNKIIPQISGKPSEYEYINYHDNKYSNVPLWVLINVLTFGNISKMYSFTKQSLQRKICSEFPEIDESKLGDLLNVLSKFRNVCAHNERLFNYKTQKSLPDLKIHKKLNINKNNSFYVCGKRDLFGVVISLKYLLPSETFKEFFYLVKKEIDIYSKNMKALTEQDVLKEMGFPNNWTNILRIKV